MADFSFSQNPVPGGQPTNRGWDVQQVRKVPTSTANAKMTTSNSEIPLWVFDIQTDFNLGGSNSQSMLTRTFWPRSFTQQSYRIQGQAPGQKELGDLAEFIHQTQRNAVLDNLGKRLVNFYLFDKGLKNVGGRMRGSHKPIAVAGYVRNFNRSHQRFDPAPNYSFDFIVARFLRSAPYDEGDPYVPPHVLKPWVDILRHRGAADWVGYVDDKDDVVISDPYDPTVPMGPTNQAPVPTVEP